MDIANATIVCISDNIWVFNDNLDENNVIPNNSIITLGELDCEKNKI